MNPIIGVSRCSRLDDYVASIELAGGTVRLLEVTESPRAVLADLDGVLLSGGGDVAPAFYGQDRHPAVYDAEAGRDEFEIDLARRALDGDVPMFAICRGMQVLNVAAGGTLVQDIPTQVASDVRHAVDTPKDALAHVVHLTNGSALSRALRGRVKTDDAVPVNSRHHQSVALVGPQLSTSATAPDGVIEAIERPGARFCIGVQWHPENFWRTGEFKPLFDAFVEAARLSRQGRRA
ncbi:MAG: putative glutamine amidotransferase [Acidobacteriota bacterium]|jgi:putative glutamine amidotransferase